MAKHRSFFNFPSAISFLIILFFIASPCISFGQTKSQLEKQKSKIEAEIKKLNKELISAQKTTRLNKNQLNALNKKINERNKLIKNINSQMGILDQQIGQTRDSINVIHSQVDAMKKEYAAIIRALYRDHGNMDKLVLIFDTPSYNRSFLRLKYFNEYSRFRRRKHRQINSREQELENQTLRLQRQRDEKNSLLAQEKKNKEELTKEQQLKQKSLNDSKANEKQISANLSKKEQQKRNLDKQIRRIIAEEVAKAAKTSTKAKAPTTTASTTTNTTAASNPSAPSSEEVALSTDFASNKGKLSWPVYYKSVIREFGKYTHASGGENMNNGIDLTTAPSATVYCIFNGVATRVFTCPNGAKGVIVRHGEFMSVYANLAIVSVKQGAKVSTKQVLGTVANTDGQGEFSFQIWKGTVPQNPRSWLR